jgi:hypothetical protein
MFRLQMVQLAQFCERGPERVNVCNGNFERNSIRYRLEAYATLGDRQRAVGALAKWHARVTRARRPCYGLVWRYDRRIRFDASSGNWAEYFLIRSTSSPLRPKERSRSA